MMLALKKLSLAHIKLAFLSCRQKEKHNCILWLPVLVGIGINIYFATGPKYICLLASATLLSFLFKRARYLSFCLCFMLIGFFAVELKTSRLKHASLKKELYLPSTLAKVEDIENFSKYKRLLLSGIKEKDIKSKYVRLVARGKLDPDIQPGDIISISAVLKPPPLPAMPYAYDFARHAFFAEIGAIGFVAGEVKIVQKGEHLGVLKYISRLRQNLSNHFMEIMGPKAGGIAAALIVGKREAIDDDLRNAIKDAGLAHLLAISGLHMSVFACYGFLLIRLLLACSENIALHFNAKKIAAVIAIFCSFVYLLISGARIATVRAFLMASWFALGVILDRISISMRSVAFAAFIILIVYPESISRPGFQMSFAAVVSLLFYYNYISARKRYVIRDDKLIDKIIGYLKDIFWTSLLSSLATGVYCAYHFNNFSIAGIFSNLFAIPLFAFFIMPVGIFGICFMKFHGIFLLPMKWGIDRLIWIAEFFARMPYASINVHEISDLCLCAITMGGLWLCLWRSRLRLLGIPLIIFGVLLGCSHKLPDVLVNEKMAAVRLEDNKLYFLKKARSNFTNRTWLQRSGQKDFLFLNKNDYNDMISCDQDVCVYSKGGRSIAFVYSDGWSDCDGFDLVINLNDRPGCSNSINKKDLSNNGAHAIYISGAGLKLISAREGRRKIW